MSANAPAKRSTLTHEQLAVVHHAGGHALVEAVPGSGKTTVLVARVRRLLRLGADPKRLLVVMFNKSAQLGFVERLRRACGTSADLPDVRTFHSLGFSMLRQLAASGRMEAWELQASSRTLERYLRQCLRSAWGEANGQHSRPSASDFQAFSQYVTLVKAQRAPAGAVWEAGSYSSQTQCFVDAFHRLGAAQAQRQVMFFDDLVYRPMMFLHEHPEGWKLFANRYDEILVDELQDINVNGFSMIQGLAGTQAQVIGCGDANQSIYGFRGSKVGLMTRAFAEQFAPCSKYPMSWTFRFGHAVSLLADHLIAHNHERSGAMVVSAEGTPETQVQRVALKPNAASGIVPLVTPRWQRSALKGAVVLARNFSHLVPFELELSEAGVPYHVYGRQGVLFLPEIASLVCAVSLVGDTWIVASEERFHFLYALLTMPTMYVPGAVVEKLAEAMVPYLDGPNRARLHEVMKREAGHLGSSFARWTAGLESRADAIRLLTSGSLAQAGAGAILKAYIRMTGMREVMERSASTPEQASESLATLDAFVCLADRSGSAIDFLKKLSPLAAHKEDKPPEGDHLMLTTLHRAKGLEWPLVMIVGLGKGVFPGGDAQTLEEDRRLAYVGITRAKEMLVLFHPEDVTLDRTCRDTGWSPKHQGPSSRFLYEAEPALSLEVSRMASGTVPQSPVRARTAGVVVPYLERLDTDHGMLAFDDKARRIDAIAKLPAIPEGRVLVVGDEVVHADHGRCQVTAVFHHPIYQVTPVSGAAPRSAVLTCQNGWHFATCIR